LKFSKATVRVLLADACAMADIEMAMEKGGKLRVKQPNRLLRIFTIAGQIL
jgi:hypothetical protein